MVKGLLLRLSSNIHLNSAYQRSYKRSSVDYHHRTSIFDAFNLPDSTIQFHIPHKTVVLCYLAVIYVIFTQRENPQAGYIVRNYVFTGLVTSMASS